MTSQYALIAAQWPELHQEAVRMECFALSDPRTLFLYGGGALLHPPGSSVVGEEAR